MKLPDIDHAFASGVSAFYHFFWDWFGVYLGSVMFACAMIQQFLFNTSVVYIAAGTLINGMFAYLFYRAQASSLKKLNALTLRFRCDPVMFGFGWKVFSISLTLSLEIIYLIQGDYSFRLHACNLLTIPIATYFPCVAVRDREPPGRTDFATQGSK
jgi:hypothetical protein